MHNPLLKTFEPFSPKTPAMEIDTNATSLSEVTDYLDRYLRKAEIPDYPTAFNGLQVEGTRPIRRIAAAVDGSEEAIKRAIRGDADLLIVHHGMFWDGGAPVTGRRYRKLKLLVESGLAVYSSHLPLDVHPEVGNNPLLATALGIEVRGTFGQYKGLDLGVWGTLNVSRETLAARMDDLLGQRIRVIPGGAETLNRVGVVTGSGASAMDEALSLGLDALVTGEGQHHTYYDAMEKGINLYYGGHYATETFGVKALSEHLAKRFGFTWEFIDVPSGL